jgi:hypothetical protein
MKTLLTIYFAAVCAFVAAQNKPSGDTRLQGIEAERGQYFVCGSAGAAAL